MAEGNFDRSLYLEETELQRSASNVVIVLPSENQRARLQRATNGGFAKRTFDIAGALTVGLVFLPVIGAVALVLKLKGEPVLFHHSRVGLKGREFDCMKFRTMVPNANKVLSDLLHCNPEARDEWLKHHKLKNDPRITKIGRFLRRTSLDELPQLWNVLRGDMSFVGPRPVVTAELPKYGRYLGFYLAVKPGLTGLWQVSGRNDMDYRRRVALDVCYVRNASVWCDFKIAFRTVKVVLFGKGAY